MKVVDVALLLSLVLTYPILALDFYARSILRQIDILEIASF
jgi:hypothetical protein